MSLSNIGWGFRFISETSKVEACVVRKIAACRYAVIKLSAADLLTLRASTSDMPRLDSAQILVVRTKRFECLEAFEYMDS